MNNRIYAVRNELTGKLVSNLTSNRKKYWEIRFGNEAKLRKKIKDKPYLKLVTFELAEVTDDDQD